MSNTTNPPSATVALTVDDAVLLAQTIGSLVAAISQDPRAAAGVALATGAANLIRNTLMPAIANMQNHALSIAEQAAIAAESAAERARVGAPQAAVN